MKVETVKKIHLILSSLVYIIAIIVFNLFDSSFSAYDSLGIDFGSAIFGFIVTGIIFFVLFVTGLFFLAFYIFKKEKSYDAYIPCAVNILLPPAFFIISFISDIILGWYRIYISYWTDLRYLSYALALLLILNVYIYWSGRKKK